MADHEAEPSVSVAQALTWTIAAALGWAALAAWQPTTTWHLVPAIVAGAGPVLLLLDAGRVQHRRTWLIGAAIGLATALLTMVVLSAVDLLGGPALFGLPHATREALVVAVATTALVVLLGLIRQARRGSTRSRRPGRSTTR